MALTKYSNLTSLLVRYSKDVIDGRIIACEKVKKAHIRFLSDLKLQDDDNFRYKFDESKAQSVLSFFGYLKHTKGELAGKIIELESFQVFILSNLFGWVRKDNEMRRFRKAYLQLARKNGKSTLLSGVALYGLMDREKGAEIYTLSNKRDQAKIVFGDAQTMANGSKALQKRVKVMRDAIICESNNSKVVPLSSDSKTLDGLNPYFAVLDEIHAMKTSELYDVVISGQGQRSQPLLFAITTAGFDLEGFCYREYKYCSSILEKVVDNEEYFIYVAELDEGDDIQNAENWKKANPLLCTNENGVSYLKSEMQTALDVPEKMRNFMTKNMNVWYDSKEDSYISMEKWNSVEKDEPNLRGKECYVGIDLSKKIDLTSVSFIFPHEDGFYVKNHSFMPEETLKEKRHTDKVPYDLWIGQGHMTTTAGAIVDYAYVQAYIQRMATINGWKIKEICYDPYNATQFATEMANDGFVVIEVSQSIRRLSEPTKAFRDMVYSEKIWHDGNPVLRWSVNNAITRSDAQENIMLDKAKSTNRIDPIASAVTGFSRAMSYANEQAENKKLNNHYASDGYSF